MAKPYSNDFRQKVITAIERDGRKKGDVSKIFKPQSQHNQLMAQTKRTNRRSISKIDKTIEW